MRVLYLSGAPNVSLSDRSAHGGPRAHVLGTLAGFRALGWQVTPYIAGDGFSLSTSDGVTDAVTGAAVPVRALADLAKVGYGLLNGMRARHRHGLDHDWVYERFALFQALGRPWQRRGLPWILETQGLLSYEAVVERRSIALGRLAQRMEIAAYRRCDVLVCVTEALKRLLVARHGIDAARILVVPNGVDADFFTPEGRRPQRCFPFLTIGYVGKLLAWQGLDRLLRAVVPAGPDIGVTIVGDGPERPGLEALAGKLGLEGRVRFLGRQPRTAIPDLIAGFDLGYSGQRTMAIGEMYHSPLKLLEYLATGVPVIASRHGDAAAVVQPGLNGFLFDDDDAAALPAAIRQARAQQAALPALSAAARATVVGRHDWPTRVRDMANGITEILERQRRAAAPPMLLTGPTAP